MDQRRKSRYFRKLFIGIFTVLCLFCAILGSSFGLNPLASGSSRQAENSTDGAEELEVTFIDVGQGDAALLICGGEAMLIDGGDPSRSSLMYNTLRSRGITYLKYVVATHPDSDHIGGLSGALHQAEAGITFCCVDENDTETFRNLKKTLAGQNKQITIPGQREELQLGGAEIELYNPMSMVESAMKDDSEQQAEALQPGSNNSSLVVRVTYGRTSFLFTGDAEWEEEQTLLRSDFSLASDVLKVAHHGSASSTTAEFLRAVAPEFAVISVGRDNSYGHPTKEVLKRLEENRVEVYRTDLCGSITMKSDGSSIHVKTEHAVGPGSSLGGGDSAGSESSFGGGDSAGGEVKASDVQPSAFCDYIVNMRSGLFHRPDCESVGKMSEKNKLYFKGNREEAAAKYKPCGYCRP